jgi:hypothetical protein
MPDYSLLFKCPRCGWWAAGLHHADESLTSENLDASIFNVECTSQECGWSATPGSDGYKKPTSHPSTKGQHVNLGGRDLAAEFQYAQNFAAIDHKTRAA